MTIAKPDKYTRTASLRNPLKKPRRKRGILKEAIKTFVGNMKKRTNDLRLLNKVKDKMNKK